MTNRGRYKYICDECQAENWLTAKDASRLRKNEKERFLKGVSDEG